MKLYKLTIFFVTILTFGTCVFFSNINPVYANCDDETSCCFILGETDDNTSFAYFLQEIFNLIKITGPILVIVLTIIELVKLIASQDKEGMNKMLAKTGKRLMYAVILFIIPSLLDFLFKIFSVYGVCGIK